MKSVGSQLREGRQALGWTIKAAAKATKIREDQLLKLEADDFAKFHAPTYIRGFVRNYATVLGLNVRKITEDLDQVLERDGEVTYSRTLGITYVPEETKISREFNPRSLFLGFFGVVLAGFLTIMGYQFYRVTSALQIFEPDSSSSVKTASADATAKASIPEQVAKDEGGMVVKKAEPVAGSQPGPTIVRAKIDDGSTPQPPVVPANVPQPTVAPVVSTAPENKLTIAAKEECWIRVSVLDNNQTKTIFENVISAGKTMDFPPANKYLVKLSIPAAVDISLNGKSYATSHADERLPVEFSVPAGEAN